MTPEEERASSALDAYESMFGEGSYPGMDSLPREFWGLIQLAELLERCVREGKSLHELVEVSEYEPGILY
jgi:hypothetical protein